MKDILICHPSALLLSGEEMLTPGNSPVEIEHVPGSGPQKPGA